MHDCLRVKRSYCLKRDNRECMFSPECVTGPHRSQSAFKYILYDSDTCGRLEMQVGGHSVIFFFWTDLITMATVEGGGGSDSDGRSVHPHVL